MLTVALFSHRTTALSSLSSTTATRSYSSSLSSWPFVKSKRSTSERHVSHADIIHALASYIVQINAWNALSYAIVIDILQLVIALFVVMAFIHHCKASAAIRHVTHLFNLLCICRNLHSCPWTQTDFYSIASPSWHPGFTHLPLWFLTPLTLLGLQEAVIFHSWPLSSMLHEQYSSIYIFC